MLVSGLVGNRILHALRIQLPNFLTRLLFGLGLGTGAIGLVIYALGIIHLLYSGVIIALFADHYRDLARHSSAVA